MQRTDTWAAIFSSNAILIRLKTEAEAPALNLQCLKMKEIPCLIQCSKINKVHWKNLNQKKGKKIQFIVIFL